MACHYMIWNREAGHTGNLKGSLQYCGADSDASGLCPEHAAFVADAKCPEVSKLDQKYWYRVPAKRKAKLGPSSVKETILPPAGRAISPVKPEWTAENQAEKERVEAAAHAKADAEAKEVKRRAAEWKDAQAKMPDTSRPADLGKGINYIGNKPDTRPMGKRAAKIDRTIDRMTALC